MNTTERVVSWSIKNGAQGLAVMQSSSKFLFPCAHIDQNWSTRFSWLNCVLRDDEAVYWVSLGHYEAVAVGIDDTGSVEGINAFIYCTK